MFNFDTPITSDLTLEAQWDCLIHDAVILTHTSGAGNIAINNLWAGPIYVNGTEVGEDGAFTATVSEGDNAVFKISAAKDTFTNWSEWAYSPIVTANGTSTALFNVNVPHMADFLVEETKLPNNAFKSFCGSGSLVESLTGFDTSTITELGERAFMQFAMYNANITAVPPNMFKFHNLVKTGDYSLYSPFGRTNITEYPEDTLSFENLVHAGGYFMYSGPSTLTSLPAGSFRLNKLKTAGSSILSDALNGAPMTELPEGSFNFDALESCDHNCFARFLKGNNYITALPAGSFSFKNLTTTLNAFCSNFCNNAKITELPTGSFQTQKLISSGFACFGEFNKAGSLRTLPAGSFKFDALKTVGDEFMRGFNSGGALVALPEGSFNFEGVTDTDGGFLYMFNYPYNGKTGALTEGDKKVAIYAPGEIEYFRVGSIETVAQGETVYVNSNPNPIDPDNATLAMVKLALATDDPASALPIGTEIADTWDGYSNPLIIAHYTDITLSDGTVKPGAYLVRKYVEPVSQQYSTTQYRYYTNSAVKAYLEGEYLQKCSAETKGLINQIKIIWMEPNYLGGFDRKEMAARFFLMSGIEIGGTKNTGEGVFWSYWKQKLGISTPSDQYTNKRIVRSRDGVARRISLRTNYPSGGMDWTSYVGTVGEVSNGSLNDEYGVLPACAIVAD